MTPAPIEGAAPKYSLPIIAFILSILGFCCCPTAMVGAVLGIVAWVRISKEPHLPGKGLAIAATFIPLALIPVVGIQAAIAIPNFIKFQARSKQSECKANLKGLYVAQKAYESDKGAWPESFDAMGWRPEAGNRYSYFLSPTEMVPADHVRHPSVAAEDHAGALGRANVEVGPHAVRVGPAGEVVAACVGNVDNDETLDVWTVSNRVRPGPNAPVPAGTPMNDVNDVME